MRKILTFVALWALGFGVMFGGKFFLPWIKNSPVLAWGFFILIVAVVLWRLYQTNAKRRDSI